MPRVLLPARLRAKPYTRAPTLPAGVSARDARAAARARRAAAATGAAASTPSQPQSQPQSQRPASRDSLASIGAVDAIDADLYVPPLPAPVPVRPAAFYAFLEGDASPAEDTLATPEAAPAPAPAPAPASDIKLRRQAGIEAFDALVRDLAKPAAPTTPAPHPRYIPTTIERADPTNIPEIPIPPRVRGAESWFHPPPRASVPLWERRARSAEVDTTTPTTAAAPAAPAAPATNSRKRRRSASPQRTVRYLTQSPGYAYGVRPRRLGLADLVDSAPVETLAQALAMAEAGPTPSYGGYVPVSPPDADAPASPAWTPAIPPPAEPTFSPVSPIASPASPALPYTLSTDIPAPRRRFRAHSPRSPTPVRGSTVPLCDFPASPVGEPEPRGPSAVRNRALYKQMTRDAKRLRTVGGARGRWSV